MKKILALLLTLALLFSLAACGGGGDEKTPSNEDKTPGSSQQQQQTQTSKPDESKPADSQPSGEEKEPLVKNVGDNIGMGSFEGLDIQWLTLAVDLENEKALLITKDIIAHWVFDSAVMEDVTWETSDIREWLNGTFYNGAFSEEQKAYILESEIVNSANPVTGTESGADTVDRVFLLSYEEAQTYFPTDESRQACYNFSQEYMSYLAKVMAETPSLEMTEQEALDELDGYNNGTDWPDSWWLRTSGDGQQTAAGVESDGVITEYHNQVWAAHGIRPAIWVNLSDEQADPVEDEPEETSDDGGEASLDNVTDSNYAALAKELFGIDVDPEGDWELVKAESTGTIGGGMGIVYQGSATVDSKELMKAYYDATADISTAGISIGQFDSISEPFADFEAFFEEGTKAGGSVGEWIYEYGGKKIELMFALSPEMELTITIDFLADNKYS